ncbi:unnamed protein product [Cuscuta campestris]|uniref:Uncharacterized protein n=1 Tax=Cuscuta campestris TaxID=132261 RepID=A0A484MMW6_9ASTE|nr:unnamed protein product [Cuscuta campestris]
MRENGSTSIFVPEGYTRYGFRLFLAKLRSAGMMFENNGTELWVIDTTCLYPNSFEKETADAQTISKALFNKDIGCYLKSTKSENSTTITDPLLNSSMVKPVSNQAYDSSLLSLSKEMQLALASTRMSSSSNVTVDVPTWEARNSKADCGAPTDVAISSIVLREGVKFKPIADFELQDSNSQITPVEGIGLALAVCSEVQPGTGVFHSIAACSSSQVIRSSTKDKLSFHASPFYPRSLMPSKLSLKDMKALNLKAEDLQNDLMMTESSPKNNIFSVGLRDHESNSSPLLEEEQSLLFGDRILEDDPDLFDDGAGISHPGRLRYRGKGKGKKKRKKKGNTKNKGQQACNTLIRPGLQPLSD